MNNKEAILDELHKYGGLQKQAGDWLMVMCPFHPDRATPSCGVRIVSEGLGIFSCLGCGEKGPWNKFAKKAGLEQLKFSDKFTHVETDIVCEETDRLLLGKVLTLKHCLQELKVPEAQPWPKDVNWRSFSGKLVHRVGGMIAQDLYNQSVYVVFPVYVLGELRGAVKAVYTRSNKDGDLNYISMRGNWVKSHGLLFYHVAKYLIEKHDYDFVIIVEGPRDALRLLNNGIPAIAILGAQAVSKTKARLLSVLPINIVYVMSDGDTGGDKMWENFKNFLRIYHPAKRLLLPEDVDPGNMPRSTLKAIIDFLELHHALEVPSLVR
jgi:DNA primase